MIGDSASREGPPPRFVFVGGLHRSGTTLLERLLAEHPAVSGLRATGAPNDEGQHLQDVVAAAGALGGPGAFAFHAGAHVVEPDARDVADARERLLAAWNPFWDHDRPVRVEKSPPNLLRFRYLQALFPEASFVAIVRHPVAVAYATQPWSGTGIGRLLRHWIVAHESFEADRPHLRRLHFLRYEDLVADPARAIAHLDDFLGIAPHVPSLAVRRDTNRRYANRWEHTRVVPAAVRRWYHAARFERRLRRLGYGYTLVGPVDAGG